MNPLGEKVMNKDKKEQLQKYLSEVYSGYNAQSGIYLQLAEGINELYAIQGQEIFKVIA